MEKIQPKLFDAYVKKVKEQISLLEGFVLPQVHSWKVNWNDFEQIISSSDRARWQQLPFYKMLLEKKHSPAVYYFEISAIDSSTIHKMFLNSRKVVSAIRISRSSGNGYRNISFIRRLSTKRLLVCW